MCCSTVSNSLMTKALITLNLILLNVFQCTWLIPFFLNFICFLTIANDKYIHCFCRILNIPYVKTANFRCIYSLYWKSLTVFWQWLKHKCNSSWIILHIASLWSYTPGTIHDGLMKGWDVPGFPRHYFSGYM